MLNSRIAQTSSQHLAYLDGLRAVAALYVLVHHASIMIDTKHKSITTKLLLAPFAYGTFMVDFFIVLSGFCLILPVINNQGKLRDGPINFYKKRAKRILPTYYIALFLSLLLIYTIIGTERGDRWNISLPVNKFDILSHIFLIQDMFPESIFKISYPFWSISVEWRIYFFFPLLLLCWNKIGGVNTTAIVLILTALIRVCITYNVINIIPFGSNPHYLGLFTIGMLSASISFDRQDKFIKLKKIAPWIWLMYTLLLLLIILLFIERVVSKDMKLFVLYFSEMIKNISIIKSIIIGLLSGVILILLSSERLKIIYSFLSYKPICFVGLFAYSIYLIHAPLLQVFNLYFIQKFHLSELQNFIAYYLIATPIIVLISYLFYLFAERPFMSKKAYRSHNRLTI